MKNIIRIICLISILPILLLAHDMSLHMSIGAQTFNVWQQFDPVFYDYISTPAPGVGMDSVKKMMTRKFYYIGLTFPDMFWPHAQSLIRGLINTLYSFRDGLKDPLYIHDHTKDNVQSKIEFSYGTNSHNLEKLYKMAKRARDNNWTPYEKSLIYGAFMHVVQDLYGHTVLQSARFGYGKCYVGSGVKSLHATYDLYLLLIPIAM